MCTFTEALFTIARTWKQPNECIWRAEVAEESDMWVNVNLPEVQIALRAKRQLFGEKVFPGQEFMVRLGKVNALRNEAVILDVQEF